MPYTCWNPSVPYFLRFNSVVTRNYPIPVFFIRQVEKWKVSDFNMIKNITSQSVRINPQSFHLCAAKGLDWTGLAWKHFLNDWTWASYHHIIFWPCIFHWCPVSCSLMNVCHVILRFPIPKRDLEISYNIAVKHGKHREIVWVIYNIKRKDVQCKFFLSDDTHFCKSCGNIEI